MRIRSGQGGVGVADWEEVVLVEDLAAVEVGLAEEAVEDQLVVVQVPAGGWVGLMMLESRSVGAVVEREISSAWNVDDHDTACQDRSIY